MCIYVHIIYYIWNTAFNSLGQLGCPKNSTNHPQYHWEPLPHNGNLFIDPCERCIITSVGGNGLPDRENQGLWIWFDGRVWKPFRNMLKRPLEDMKTTSPLLPISIRLLCLQETWLGLNSAPLSIAPSGQSDDSAAPGESTYRPWRICQSQAHCPAAVELNEMSTWQASCSLHKSFLFSIYQALTY